MKKILFFVMIVVNCHVYTASSSSLDATKESIKIYNKGASVLSLLKDMELLKSFRDEIKVLDNRTVTMNGSIDVTYMRYISDTLFSVDADMNIAYEEKQKDSKKEIYEFLKKKVQGGLEDSFTTPLNDTKEKQ